MFGTKEKYYKLIFKAILHHFMGYFYVGLFDIQGSRYGMTS